jgi:hypothetical protein
LHDAKEKRIRNNRLMHRRQYAALMRPSLSFGILTPSFMAEFAFDR